MEASKVFAGGCRHRGLMPLSPPGRAVNTEAMVAILEALKTAAVAQGWESECRVQFDPATVDGATSTGKQLSRHPDRYLLAAFLPDNPTF